MSKKIGLALIINTLATITLFAKTTTLTEALQKKWVKVAVVKILKDQHEGKSLHLQMDNASSWDLTIIVPAGLIFNPSDSNSQSFINLQTETIELALRRQTTSALHAMCIHAGKKSPLENAEFFPAQMATGNLLKMAQFVDNQNINAHYDVQAALWATVDDTYFSGIEDAKLLDFTAQLLNKPKPDYRTRYRSTDEGGLIAAEALQPLAIKGQFVYTLPEDMSVKLDLVNDKGESVIREMNLQTMRQTKGRHRFSFEFDLTGVPHGAYFVTMTAERDKKEWGKMKVLF